ncbi:sensor histidine kinase [Anaeromicropila herbilytica]|uniref:histidine kinase n=1 Tax=Anaeromicropila herbilytica TaxID=2785025 RepID=A0A7R7IBV8_9FIRM|nr:HAMP domain-containing sensor histidine kinase [Anaeromicropila herbilytica]BCN29254.1 two-component sensor histidine kinase [Anaeromicropila herbilytica]
MIYDVLYILCAGILLLSFLILMFKYIRLRREIRELEHKMEYLITDSSIHYLYTKEGRDTETLTYQINQLLNRYQNEKIALSREQTARKQLISNISHDLKTPLAGIIGYLEAIENNLVKGEEQSEYLGIALHKSYDLKQRISELFELVRIDADEIQFQIEKVEIGELLRLIAIEFSPRLEEESFEYDFNILEQPHYMKVDVKAFIRMIQNLVDNVLEHANCGKYLGISSNIVNDTIVIDIIDHGGGIAKKDSKYIFDRLYQADEARSNHGGLGLAITYELVNRMGGSISLYENTKEKTVFRLIFPKVL